MTLPAALARPRSLVPAALALALAGALALLGHRLFADATAAVYYNADSRIPEAVSRAWLFACAWGLLNAALAYVGYRRGVLGRGVTRVVAASVLVLDVSFVLVLGFRGGAGDVIASLVFAAVVGGLGLLSWRRSGLGGALLAALATVMAMGTLFNSATYEGEAAGLLFDEDELFLFLFGLVPLVSGLLSLFSGIGRAGRI